MRKRIYFARAVAAGPPPPPNYFLRLPGGTNGAGAVYGLGPTDTRLAMGSDFELEIRHRTTQNNAQYLLNIGWGTTQLAIIRHFVSGRYEAYAQGAAGFRLAAPLNTVPGVWYIVRVTYANGMLRIYVDGQLAAEQAISYSYPFNPSTPPALLIATSDPQYGSDYGDYDYVQLKTNGVVLCRYEMSPDNGLNVIDSTGTLGLVYFNAGTFILA